MKISHYCLILTLTSNINAHAGNIYVCPATGDDANGGTISQPMRTIEQAMLQAREWRRSNDARIKGGIHIILRGGVYRPAKPLFVRPEDSGTADSPTIIEGYDGEWAAISGGEVIGGWESAQDDLHIPPSAIGKALMTTDAPMYGNHVIEPRQLWIGGRRMTMAQQQPQGIMTRMVGFDTSSQTISIPTPPILTDRLDRMEMLVHQRWAVAMLRVKDMRATDEGNTLVSFHEPESQIEFAHPWPQPVIDGERGNSAYILRNSMRFLDEEGEWCQDPTTGRIVVMPTAGYTPGHDEAIIPVMERLLYIGGTRERRVSHVMFRNVTFEYTAWTRPSYEGHVTLQGGFPFIDGYKLRQEGLWHNASLENQAWIARPESAVSIRYADNITFDGCHFQHIGNTALDMEYAVSQTTVANCTMDDIGGTAILVGWFGEDGQETHIPYVPTIAEDLCHDITVSGCDIHDVAVDDWGCVGIGAGYVRDITIHHNRLSGLSYSGICVGWGWTARESGMRNNHITNNIVTDYAKHLYDAGGIYTLSNQPGSSIKGNTIGSPYPAPYATNNRAFAIYFDEATDGYTVSGNTLPDGPLGYNKPGKALVIDQPGHHVGED